MTNLNHEVFNFVFIIYEQLSPTRNRPTENRSIYLHNSRINNYIY